MKAVIVTLVFIIISVIIFMIIRDKRIPTAMKILVILGLLYPIAKTCQFAIIGPRFLRWYLTDYGFVIMSAVAYIPLFVKKKFSEITYLQIPLITGATLGFILASIVEITQIFSGYILGNDLLIKKNILVRGDYTDFLMYFLGFLTVLLISLDSSLKKKTFSSMTTNNKIENGRKTKRNRQRTRIKT